MWILAFGVTLEGREVLVDNACLVRCLGVRVEGGIVREVTLRVASRSCRMGSCMPRKRRG